MQRSVRPFLIPDLPHGRPARRICAAVGVAAILLALGAGPALAHDDRGGRGAQHWSQQNRQTTAPTTQPQATGAYVYVKKDAFEPASWENSTQQYLVATWPDASYRDLTLDEIRAALPAGVKVCGTGWAVQEDQVNGTEAVFTDHKAPSYPNDYIGHPPIFAAKHWELSAMVTVPACGVVAPTAPAEPKPTPSASVPCPPSATPTPTPTVPTSPTATPTATQVAAPTPTSTPTAEVGPASNPSPTATSTRSAEAVAAAVASPSPSESFYSEVLAAGGDGSAVLAATGSSVGPVVLAGGVLVLAGAALLVLRRRHAA